MIHGQPIEAVELHAHGDASGRGALVRQTSGISQGIDAAKSRMAKRSLTIPKLELVAGHMAVKLVHNLRTALEGFLVKEIHCWLDSTAALHWICGGGEHRQFVENCVWKIQNHNFKSWRRVPLHRTLVTLVVVVDLSPTMIFGGKGQRGCVILNSGLKILRQALVRSRKQKQVL